MAFLYRPTSRRSVLWAIGASSLFLAGGGLLEACGVTSTSTSNKRGGTLRVAISDGGLSDTLDPNYADYSYAGEMRSTCLYDTLLYSDHNYKIQPALAEEVTPSADAVDWTIRLRKGVTFHDGKTLTADDVVFSLQRLTDPKNTGDGPSILANLSPAGVSKADDQTVKLHLNHPDVTLPASLANLTIQIIPVGFDPKNPIGTGPFKFKSFTPGQQSVFVRNENYWITGQPYLDEVDIIDYPDPTARVNALLSGQVDCLDKLSASQIGLVKANSNLRVISQQTGSAITIAMRSDVPPFNDVRVRQAMQLIADRPQLIQQALGGLGKLGNDILDAYDPFYPPPNTPQRQQDLEQAKSLLNAAGQSNLTVTFTTAPTGGGWVESATVFAEQAKLAGVTLNINKLTVNQYYGPDYKTYLLSQGQSDTEYAFIDYAFHLLPDSPYNRTRWSDPEFTSLATQARQQIDPAKQRELVEQCMRIEYDRGPRVVWGFPQEHTAYSAKFTGFVQDPSGTGPNGGYLRELRLA